MTNIQIKKVATNGCEISSEVGIFAWAISNDIALLIKLAIEQYLKEEK
jgi:hypothetical protein